MQIYSAVITQSVTFRLQLSQIPVANWNPGDRLAAPYAKTDSETQNEESSGETLQGDGEPAKCFAAKLAVDTCWCRKMRSASVNSLRPRLSTKLTRRGLKKTCHSTKKTADRSPPVPKYFGAEATGEVGGRNVKQQPVREDPADAG